MRKTPLQRLVQERTGRPIEDLLRELYVEKRYSDQEIATALGGDIQRATIQQWREQYGITRAPIEPLVA